MAATPPPALAADFRNSSQRTGVPYDLLVGIWQNETSGAYPNPYENGLGYGGVLGTRVGPAWGSASQQRRIPGGGPPINVQVDTAAQILATQLASHGGDVAGALSAYSGGGYTSVPGQTETHVDPSSLHVTAGRSGGINTGSATGAGPVGDAAVSAAHAVTGWVGDILDAVKQYALRIAEVVGGGLLILGGLFLISGFGGPVGAAVAGTA